MNMKRNLINVAVLSTLGLAGAANAVYLSEDGTGEVLLYPYYTVRNGTDTIITIVNSDTVNAKAVKVRIIEGKNSREVLDFNLYMSPADVWTGTLTTTTDGGKLITTDTSCTVPAIATNQGGLGYAEFRNYYFSGTNADGESTSLDRTREGYIEVIEEGNLTGVITQGDGTGTIAVAAAATHSNGVPQDCAALRKAWATGGAFAVNGGNTYASEPTGGLFGSGTLINVAGGTDYSYDPVALDAWSNAAQHTAPGGILPNLAQVAPKTSYVFYGGSTVMGNWNNSYAVDPVSAVLMRDSVMNEFVTDTGLAAGTDWVVTFPTKNAYVSPDTDTDADSVDKNFLRPFTQDFKSGGACEEVSMTYWGREEEHSVSEVDFSPPPPSGKNEICWETNVITFNGSNVLGSSLSYNVSTSAVGENGWMKLGFPASSVTDSNSDVTRQMIADSASPTALDTYHGLPVIGFGVQKYVNGNMGGVLSNYGGSFIHKYTRTID